jgi:hypothetical protein
MAYGHAERTLAAIRLLEAETRELLSSPVHLDPEHRQWLQDAADTAAQRLRSAGEPVAKDRTAAGGQASPTIGAPLRSRTVAPAAARPFLDTR